MIRHAISAEFYRLSRHGQLLFWGFVFIPLLAQLGSLAFELPSTASNLFGMRPRVDLFERLAGAAEITGTALAKLFYVAAAAVIFGGEYDAGTWRLLVPRTRRMNLMFAKALFYALAAALSLALIALGTGLCALLAGLLRDLPVVLHASSEMPFLSIAMCFGVSWIELMLFGFAAGMIAIAARSALVSVVCMMFIVFCDSMLTSLIGIGNYSWLRSVALPGYAAEVMRFFVLHKPLTVNRYITIDTAVPAAASLVVWTLGACFFISAWFNRQELARE
jgi:hypothetical protein